MPRYYIDTSDQDVFCRDEEGGEYLNLDTAKAAAVSALPDMARDQLPDGDARTFTAVIRDQHQTPILLASLTLYVSALAHS